MKRKQTTMTLKNLDFSKVQFTELFNLLLNMSSGLEPKDLSADEVRLLEANFGEFWFQKLGYSEPDFSKPKQKRK